MEVLQLQTYHNLGEYFLPSGKTDAPAEIVLLNFTLPDRSCRHTNFAYSDRCFSAPLQTRQACWSICTNLKKIRKLSASICSQAGHWIKTRKNLKQIENVGIQCQGKKIVGLSSDNQKTSRGFNMTHQLGPSGGAGALRRGVQGCEPQPE